MKVEYEKMERQIIHLNQDLHTIENKENNSTIETKFDQYGNKVSMFETVEEVGEDTVTKEENILLTREPISFLLSGNVDYLC